jgi:inner membrane protein
MMDFSAAQFWLIAGIILLLIEIFSISFFAIFLSFGAFCTSLLTALDLTPTQPAQTLIFASVSLGSMLVLRKLLLQKFGPTPPSTPAVFDEFVGSLAIVSATIVPLAEGRIRYRGTEWIAIADEAIAEGTSVTIVRMEGIRVVVKPLYSPS